MNLTIPAVDLKRYVKRLAAVQGQTIVINNGLSVFDGDAGIVINCFKTDAPITVGSRLFSSICNKLAGQVSILNDGGSLVIKAGKFAASIPTLKNSQLSPLTTSSLSELTVDTKMLSDLLTFASAVTNEKDTFDHTGAVRLRTVEVGVHPIGSFIPKKEPDSGIDITATDNLRIARDEYRGFGIPSGFNLLVPTKIIRAIKDLDGQQTTISQSETSIFFKSDDTTVYTRKLNKKFPDVNRVFPKTYKLEAEIKVQSFLEVLQKVMPTIDPEATTPIVWLEFLGDVLKVKTGNGTVGKSQDEIGIIPILPDALDDPYYPVITVNIKFLVDALTSLKGCDTILFKCNQTAQPFLMQADSKQILIAGVKT